MTSRSVSKPDVREELWHSFAVLLKSYAAAASMHGLEHGVLELTTHSLNIIAASTTLAVGYFPVVGKGTWSLTGQRSQERGTFELNHDGTVVLDGAEIDMDHAAIQLIGSLSGAAKPDKVEVPA
jgi:hypothetical protein